MLKVVGLTFVLFVLITLIAVVVSGLVTVVMIKYPVLGILFFAGAMGFISWTIANSVLGK